MFDTQRERLSMIEEMAIPDEFVVPGDVRGRRVVLTGASRGLGRVLAHAFARAGARLVVVARGESQLRDLLREMPGDHLMIPADVRDPDANDEIADRTVAEWGGLDVWIANAAISTFVADPVKTNPDEWRAMMDVNISGVFFGIRAAARVMTRGGRIIVTGSVLGERPVAGLSAYATTKAALIGMVRATAIDLGSQGVTVNLITPGWFDSPLAMNWKSSERHNAEILNHTALHRWGTSEDLPGAYLFLASEAAGFVTGATLAVDGGYLCM